MSTSINCPLIVSANVEWMLYSRFAWVFSQSEQHFRVYISHVSCALLLVEKYLTFISLGSPILTFAVLVDWEIHPPQLPWWVKQSCNMQARAKQRETVRDNCIRVFACLSLFCYLSNCPFEYFTKLFVKLACWCVLALAQFLPLAFVLTCTEWNWLGVWRHGIRMLSGSYCLHLAWKTHSLSTVQGKKLVAEALIQKVHIN